MFQWFMGGDPEEVIGRWANLTHPYIDVEDTAAAVIRFKSGALGVLSGTTSASWSHMSIVIHGSKGHSIGVMEEPEGAIGYNHVWNIPGEEGTVERSLAEHVERGEYMFRIDNSASLWSRPATWTTAYQYKQPGEPNYHARQIADLVESIRTGRKPAGGRLRGQEVGRDPPGRLRIEPYGAAGGSHGPQPDRPIGRFKARARSVRARPGRPRRLRPACSERRGAARGSVSFSMILSAPCARGT